MCVFVGFVFCFFFFKQKTAYEMRISDWSSDVCSSDLSTVTISFDPASPILTSANRPDVILLDWNMPVMSGMEFLGAFNDLDFGIEERPREIGRASCRERVCQYV